MLPIQSPAHSDLHAAYATGACPICALLARSERRYIDAALYEHVTDATWRAQVREARGFCALHTERVLEVSRSALGVALVAADILKTVRTALPAATPARRWRRGSRSRAAAEAVRPRRRCPLCGYLEQLSAVYISALLDDLATDAGRQAYAASPGLCLPHFGAAAARGSAGFAVVQEHQTRAWQQLEHELEEFARKHDYRNAGAAMTEAERDAWRRALRLLAGSQPTMPSGR
ncbi:DUF6062 family protein [Kallotenue papyrolyticum]|uniref:DUF6062 family protein n=1 Tax=Kallotenue papyrolyticum TaxID=1325125 RepID=UPI000492754C|nr:DUF6062 family protein [Kallotenue papyrolyticum]